MRKDVRGVGYGGSIVSVYAGCIDYEVRRKEVGEGYIVELRNW